MLASSPDAVNEWAGGVSAPDGRSVLELTRRRYSCRAYVPEPIAPEQRAQIEALLSSISAGPLGTAVRLRLVAATENDARALRGLGSYGFIAGATAFIVGAHHRGDHDLEDYGHAMERAILGATALGLGTCWLNAAERRRHRVAAEALSP
jgi:nitroreductase